MFSAKRYFIRLSLRHLFKRQLGYTLINIAGLAIGFVSFLAAILFSYDELTYDRFHPNYNQVFRLVVDWDGDGIKRDWARSSVPVGRVSDGTIPEIQERVRIRKNPGSDLLKVDEALFYETQLLLVEEGFFNFFGFELKNGLPEEVLADKYNIVLTESTSRKYFGDSDPIGKTIRYDGKYDLKVTGIAKDPALQSHIQFDVLLSFLLLDEMFSESRLAHWGQFDHYTYVRTTANSSQVEVESKMHDFLLGNAPEWVNEKMAVKLQPISSIHLESQRLSELSANSNKSYSIVFVVAASLILLVAILNYINLSTATFLARSKEIVMRKVLGSSKRSLLLSLVAESVLLSILAMCIAMALMTAILPKIGLESGKNFQDLDVWVISGLSFIISLTIGLIAGIIPASQLSMQQNFSAGLRSSAAKSRLGSIMIMTQLVISSLLIMAMLGVSRQLSYIQNTDLGFVDNDILIIPIKDRSNNSRYETTTNQLKSVAGIKAVSFSSSTPGSSNALTYTYKISGANRKESVITTIILDENYFELYAIELAKGRFPLSDSDDNRTQIILNQAAVDFFEIEEPIGKTVTGKAKGTIVGVVENFQVNTLHSPIEPLIMFNYIPTLRYVSIKPVVNFDRQSIDKVAEIWASIYTIYPMEYSFLSDNNLRLYNFEQGVLFSLDILVMVAIFISTIGLIGHAILLRRQNAREYSIRKVLGGSSTLILTGTFKKLLPTLIVVIVLVGVLGFWGLNQWMENFAFRSPLGFDVYLLPTLAMISLFVILVGGLIFVQLKKAPIKFLRNL